MILLYAASLTKWLYADAIQQEKIALFVLDIPWYDAIVIASVARQSQGEKFAIA